MLKKYKKGQKLMLSPYVLKTVLIKLLPTCLSGQYLKNLILKIIPINFFLSSQQWKCPKRRLW